MNTTETAQRPLGIGEYWCRHCGLRAVGGKHVAEARWGRGDPTTWQGRRCPNRLTVATPPAPSRCICLPELLPAVAVNCRADHHTPPGATNGD